MSTIETVLNEMEAVDHALAALRPGDLLMVLADKVPPVLAYVQRFTEGSAAV